MNIKKLVQIIEKVADERSEAYIDIVDDNELCYAEGYCDALQYVLALIEEESNEIT